MRASFYFFCRALDEAKSFSALIDGQQHLLPKHIIRRILREINLVETYCPSKSEGCSEKVSRAELTCVSLGQPVRISVSLVDREPLDSLDSLKIDEAAERHSGSASRKAENLGPFIACE